MTGESSPVQAQSPSGRRSIRPLPPEVIKVGPKEARLAADAATRGFLDNEIWMWLLPKDRARARVIKRHHRSMVKHIFIPRDAAWTTAEATGGAFWFPPGTQKLNFREVLAESLPFLPEGLPHMGRAARFETEVKKHWPEKPHWYLAVLSVSPEVQGKGHGSALLKPGLERCDRDGTPAYLETQREKNVGFYEKFGFELVEKLVIDGELPVWLMLRPAR